jgi:mono/diheme cytochrome c family protein
MHRLLKLTVIAALSMSTFAFAADDTAALWKSKCKSCHGLEGKADTKEGQKLKLDDMSTDKWQTEWTDQKVKEIVTNGKKDKDGKWTKMKPFGPDAEKDKQLTEAQIDALVKHVRTFKK